jgi:hypothetical protein
MSIGDHQTQEVRKVASPGEEFVNQNRISPDSGSDLPSPVTCVITEETINALEGPSGAVEGTATLAANNINAGAPIGSGKFSPGHETMICQKCGAVKCSFGLEPDLEMYVSHTVEIFREIRRVLRSDGVLWCNMGDSYSAQAGQRKSTDARGPKQCTNRGSADLGSRNVAGLKPKDLIGMPFRVALALQQDGWFWRSTIPFLKRNAMPESVQGSAWVRHRIKVKPGFDKERPHPSKIPGGMSRIPNSGGVFKNQAEYEDCPGCQKCSSNDGYVLRMSAGRPSTAVEYIFLFAKTKTYFYDAEAIKLRAGDDTHARYARGRSDRHKWADGGPGDQTIARSFAHMMGKEIQVPDSYHGSIPGRRDGPGQDRRSMNPRLPGVNPKAMPKDEGRDAQGLRTSERMGHGPGWRNKQNESFSAAVKDVVGQRSRRNSDWFFESWQGLLGDEDGQPLAMIVNTAGFPGAHFATFPAKMVEPLIKSGTPEKGVCPKCGSAWVRVIGNKLIGQHPIITENRKDLPGPTYSRHRTSIDGGQSLVGQETKTIGWKPTCKCEVGAPVPAVVLDPFGGAGTTLLVATRLKRNCISMDIKMEYLKMTEKRLRNVQIQLIF